MYQSNRAYKGVGFTPVILFEQTCQIQDLVETPSSSGPTLISCPGFNPFHAHQWYSSIVKSPLKTQSCLMILCKGSASTELPTNSFSVAISLMTPSWQMATVAHSDLLMSSCHSNHPVKLQNILCFIAEKIRESGHSSGGSSNLPANATLVLVWQRRFLGIRAVQKLYSPMCCFPGQAFTSPTTSWLARCSLLHCFHF